MEREREVDIECVQSDRNAFMSRDRERERVCVCVFVSGERRKRTATG